MPVTINPSASALYPTSIQGPADGDLANAASVNTAFQSIMNAADVARLVLYGSRLKPRYFCDSGNQGPPPFGPIMTVRPMGQIFLTNGAGSWITHFVNVSILVNLINANGGNPLAPLTRYYLYYTTIAGVIDSIVDTNPPQADLHYGQGSSDRVYIGTFLTSGVASNIWTFTQDGTYLYDGKFSVLTGGQAAAWTAIDPFNSAGNGNVVPLYARQIRFYFEAVNNAGAAEKLFFSPLNAFGGGIDFTVPAGGRVTGEFTMNVGNGTQVWYKWLAGGADVSAALHVRGWIDGAT